MLLNDHWSMITGYLLLAAVLIFLVLLQKPKVRVVESISEEEILGY